MSTGFGGRCGRPTPQLFGTATRRAVADAEQYEARVSELQVGWRERLGGVRANSAADLLINALPGAPILTTVQSAATLIGRSEQATNQAIPRLAAANILRQINIGRRNRAFEATEMIEAFADLERRLASPEADTRFSPPMRAVPRRPVRSRTRGAN